MVVRCNLVSSGDLDEVIEVVKKVIVYGEVKSNGGSQYKNENKQKPPQGGGKGGKGSKGLWGASGNRPRLSFK